MSIISIRKNLRPQLSADFTPLLAVALVACGGGGGGGGGESASQTPSNLANPARPNPPVTPAPPPVTPAPPPPPPVRMDVMGSLSSAINADMVTVALSDADIPLSNINYMFSVGGTALTAAANVLTIPTSAYGREITIEVRYTDHFGSQTITDRVIHDITPGESSGVRDGQAAFLPDEHQDFINIGRLFGDDDDVVVVVIDHDSTNHGARVQTEAQAFLPQAANVELSLSRGDGFALDGSFSTNHAITAAVSKVAEIRTASGEDNPIIFVITSNTIPEGLVTTISNSIVILSAGNEGASNPWLTPEGGSTGSHRRYGGEVNKWDDDLVAFAVGLNGNTKHSASNAAGLYADMSFAAPYQSSAGDSGPGTSFSAPQVAAELALLYEALRPYEVSLEDTLAFAKQIANRHGQEASSVGHGQIELESLLHSGTSHLNSETIEGVFTDLGFSYDIA